MLNSFSNSMTSSTMSRLSAPRSSMNDASFVSFSRSTPSSFAMMSLTFSVLSAMRVLVRIWGGTGTIYPGTEAPGSRGRGSDHAAVDHEDLARDVGGEVRRQERHRARDVGRRTQTLQRD